MAYIEVVIKIPEEIYESSKRECEENPKLIIDTFTYAIGKGIPIPKGHGKLKDIDKFPVNEIEIMKYNYECGENECHSEEIVYWDDIINAETIIEADKAELRNEDKK